MSNPSTPTANISPKSSTTTPNLLSASRRIEHENIDLSAEDQLQILSESSSRYKPLNPSLHQRKHETPGEGSSLHSRPEEDVSVRRPTKRIRRARSGNMSRERPSSSSDSSSQSGMADNETEAERSQQSELSIPTVAPPKKKRTRTLTTPHQSSVLHALLAQSRFPTTAMREEVGRQIGLSARKVQIWFQNQRQKARRPQAESSAPLSRPPQFGPFPSASGSTPSTASSFPPHQDELTDQSVDAGPSASRTSEAFDLDPGLSGPGMPGAHSRHHRRPESAGDWELSRRDSVDPVLAPALAHSRTSLGAEETRGLREAKLPSMRSLVPRPHHPPDDDRSTDPSFSRTLPPLNFGASDSHNVDRFASPTSYLPLPYSRNLNVNVNSMPSSSLSAHHPPDQGSSGYINIPPPFALQPPPQWDPQSFTPYTRPEFASWSDRPRRSQSARGSFSAVGAHDRSTPNISRGRHYFPSTGEQQHTPSFRPRPFDPIHDIITASRGQTAADLPRLAISRDGSHREGDEVQDYQ
ncbi:hypothetical protein BJ138DRAFT_1212721 [Hygrophoropsis aurantiaca]|uniref:Uncharacterized protein n=1 Tax=Hygrophoropsis aurantiaca TaxID=72124 RepID=A0ACB8A3K4_9AGAM|nr:hypothetical protein BJ138DRAFT_1212721 [Hygrophoropsis aurantiaca]